MKAFRSTAYMSPDQLRLQEVDEPVLNDDAVLVRVRAVSVNAYDWHMLRGKPYVARVGQGLRRPKSGLMGRDASGEVVAVGKNVTHLQPGDEVFGSCRGAFAEYAAGAGFVAKPARLTFEEASALPVAGCTALQALRDKGHVQAGQKVAIVGAGGGVGTLAVQVATALGAEVTAVTSSEKTDLARSLGAHHVIDYGREDFTRSGKRWDVVIDVGGYTGLSSLARLVGRRGTAVLLGAGSNQWLGPLPSFIAAATRSRFSTKKIVPLLSRVTRKDLSELADLVERGELTPVIDHCYAFEELPEALLRLESGAARGKLVVSL